MVKQQQNDDGYIIARMKHYKLTVNNILHVPSTIYRHFCTAFCQQKGFILGDRYSVTGISIIQL